MKAFIDSTTPERIGPLSVRVTTDPAERKQVAQWLKTEHELGAFKPVGHTLIQIVEEAGQTVAVLIWAASAYHLKDREAWISWDAVTCAQRRNLIVNNTRLLIREAARRPNLASHVLQAAVPVLPQQWQDHFGYQPLLAETFTDPERHAGTCYKVSGWEALGMTAGHRRHRCDFYLPNERPKRLWVKPLHPQAQARLCAPELAPEHAAGETVGAGARCALKTADLASLAQTFRLVRDPRSRTGLQYPLPPILTVLALALLLGKKDLAEMVRVGQRLSQTQRQRIGFRLAQGTYYVPTPCYHVYRDVLHALDVEQFGQRLTEWLNAHRGHLPATLAMDGKVIRERLGLVVTLLDVEAGVPVAVAADPRGKGDETACARKLLQSEAVPLLNQTVIADSLHTNAANAHFIVQEKGGDYIAALKDNQEKLHAVAHRKLDGATPLLPTVNAVVVTPMTVRCGSNPSNRTRRSSPMSLS
jgi:hypothetical protein